MLIYIKKPDLSQVFLFIVHLLQPDQILLEYLELLAMLDHCPVQTFALNH